MSEVIRYRIYDNSSTGFTFGLYGDLGTREPYIKVEGEGLEYDRGKIISGTVTKITIGEPLSSISFEGGISVEQLDAYDPGWYGGTIANMSIDERYLVDFANIKSGVVIQLHQTHWEAQLYDPSTNEATSGADRTIFAHHDDSVLKAEYEDSDDHLVGRAGNDKLYASSGKDTLTGGQGEDTFYVELGSEWSDSVKTKITDFEPGKDVLEITVDDSSVTSLDDLEIISLPWVTYINAPNGNQIALEGISSLDNVEINLSTRPTPMGPVNGFAEQGSDFDDNMVGEFGVATVDGKAGDDRIEVISAEGEFGGRIYGGTGDDTIIGGDGDDRLFGSGQYSGLGKSNRKESDHLSGGAGNDELIGGTLLEGGEGDDRLVSAGFGPGSILDGGSGNDSLISGVSEDWIIGGDGDDWLYFSGAEEGVKATLSSANSDGLGTAKNDMVIGVENIFGTRFSDNLTGDNEDNTLGGGGGRDILTGMGGNDTFLFGKRATVTDFEDGVDRISLEGYRIYPPDTDDYRYVNYDDIVLKQDGDTAVVSYKHHYGWQSMYLENTDISQINESDFIFT